MTDVPCFILTCLGPSEAVESESWNYVMMLIFWLFQM